MGYLASALGWLCLIAVGEWLYYRDEAKHQRALAEHYRQLAVEALAGWRQRVEIDARHESAATPKERLH